MGLLRALPITLSRQNPLADIAFCEWISSQLTGLVRNRSKYEFIHALMKAWYDEEEETTKGMQEKSSWAQGSQVYFNYFLLFLSFLGSHHSVSLVFSRSLVER